MDQPLWFHLLFIIYIRINVLIHEVSLPQSKKEFLVFAAGFTPPSRPYGHDEFMRGYY